MILNGKEKIEILYKSEHKNESIWQIFIANYPSKIITHICYKYTKLTPNNITFLGALLFLFSLVFYFNGSPVIAAIIFQLSFMLDIVDGNIAILRKKQSKLGAFLDISLDWIKPGVLYLILFFVTQNIFLLVLLLINYLAAANWRITNNILCEKGFFDNKSLLQKFNENQSNKSNKSNILSSLQKFNKIVLSKISAVETEALIAVFFAITLNDIFIYLAIIIRTKDYLMGIISSVIKLYTADSIKSRLNK
jgi:hypothetical protein